MSIIESMEVIYERITSNVDPALEVMEWSMGQKKYDQLCVEACKLMGEGISGHITRYRGLSIRVLLGDENVEIRVLVRIKK